MFELLTANLNLADRDGLFFFISSSDGIIVLFMYFSNNSKSFLVSGKYLEGFDLFLGKVTKVIFNYSVFNRMKTYHKDFSSRF